MLQKSTNVTVTHVKMALRVWMKWTGIHVSVDQVSREPIVKQVWVYAAKYKNFKFHLYFQNPEGV